MSPELSKVPKGECSIASEQSASQGALNSSGLRALWFALWLLVASRLFSGLVEEPLGGQVLFLFLALFSLLLGRCRETKLCLVLVVVCLVLGLPKIVSWQTAVDGSSTERQAGIPKKWIKETIDAPLESNGDNWQMTVTGSCRLELISPILPWDSGHCQHQPYYDVKFRYYSFASLEERLFSFGARQQRRGICGFGYIQACIPREIVVQGLTGRVTDKYGHLDGFSLLSASVFGEKELLSEQVEHSFRVLGISHLLVVSGFHVGVIYSAAYFILSLLIARFGKLFYLTSLPIFCSSLSLIVVAFYSLFVGLKLPVVRAVLVIFIGTFGGLCFRRVNRAAVFLFSALCVETIWPGMLFEPGGQLTFLALAGLLLADVFIKAHLSSGRNIFYKLLSTFVFSIGAWLMSASAVLAWFGETTLLSPLFNVLLGVPYSVLVICCGPIAVLCFYFGCEMGFYFQLLDTIYSVIEDISRSEIATSAVVELGRGNIPYWMPVALLMASSLLLVFLSDPVKPRCDLATSRPARRKGKLRARKALPPKTTSV